MSPSGREARRAVLTEDPSSCFFPEACVCCMSPPAERRDLHVRYEMMEFLDTRMDKTRGKVSVHRVASGRALFREVPYCRAHAAEFDRLLDESRSKGRPAAPPENHEGWADQSALFGFTMHPRGLVELPSGARPADIILEFDNAEYTAAFREANSIFQDPTTAAGWASASVGLFAPKVLREVGAARRAKRLAKKADVDGLLAMLDHANLGVRRQAISRLHGFAGDPRVVAARDRLVALMRTDPEEDLRGAAFGLLVDIDHPDVANILLEALPDLPVRVRRGMALGFLNHPRALEFLGALLADPDPECRRSAVTFLVLKGEEGRRMVASALQDENHRVREAASRALGGA